jgi:uncharacterized damage-inducible protein DinB
MTISETMLPEFDQEMAMTRKTLERIPEDKLGWKPHVKSFSMAELSGHIANVPSWAALTIKQDTFDMAPPGAPPFKNPVPKSRAEVLDMFDKNVKEARESLAGASDEHLMKNWSLLSGGNAVMTMPRAPVLRSFVMNHIIHHRAQLGVYLRLNDVPVPSIYGPSADESPM